MFSAFFFFLIKHYLAARALLSSTCINLPTDISLAASLRSTLAFRCTRRLAQSGAGGAFQHPKMHQFMHREREGKTVSQSFLCTPPIGSSGFLLLLTSCAAPVRQSVLKPLLAAGQPACVGDGRRRVKAGEEFIKPTTTSQFFPDLSAALLQHLLISCSI